jgi:hypothetical protein
VRTQYSSVKIKKAVTPLFPKKKDPPNIQERKASAQKYTSASPAVIVPIIILRAALAKNSTHHPPRLPPDKKCSFHLASLMRHYFLRHRKDFGKCAWDKK